MNPQPPPLAEAHPAIARPSGRRRSLPWIPALALLLGLLWLPMAVRLVHELHLPFPRCALRTLTGIPCPACGSTRSLIAWADLDPLSALRLNPLFFLVCLAVAGWVLHHLAVPWTRWQVPTELKRWARPFWNTRVAVALIVLNWIYLWITLPK